MDSQLTRQIQTDLDRFCAAWSTTGAAALGDFYVADATLVNPFGQRAQGREAVAGMYTAFFAGMLRGTSTTYALTDARPVGDDHVLTDGEQIVRGPDGEVVLALRLTALLRREGGAWRFVDARPYLPAAPPA